MSNYYDNEAISQSKIKLFIESKSEFKSIYVDKYKEQKDTDNKKFGRLYHTYLYRPELLANNYICIPDSTIVTSMMGQFIENMANGLTSEQAYTLSGFKQSFDTTWKQFKENTKNQNYYNLLLEAQGKTIISELDRNIAKKMKQVYIQDNEHLLRAKRDNWLLFPEQEIYFKSSSSILDLKMMADLILIKPDFTEVIIEDAKSTDDMNISAFISTIKRYRYDIQQSFYKIGVTNWIEQTFNKIVPIDNIKFIFVPQRKSYPYEILDFVEIDSYSEDRAYTDWTVALGELEYCLTTGDWSKDRSSYKEGRKILKVW